MTLYVVRHGQTDLNIQKRMQGRKGLPLNATGLEQARECAKNLDGVKFERVFSSPQERAVQTARIASHGAEVETDERLQPFDVGSADNQVIDEKMKLTVGLIPDPEVYTGVENPQDFVARVYSFMNEIKDEYAGKDVNIMIAGHKCTTGCIDCFFNGLPSDGDFFSRSVKNGKFRTYEL